MNTAEKEIAAQLTIAIKAIKAAERAVIDTYDPQKLEKIQELITIEQTLDNILVRNDSTQKD